MDLCLWDRCEVFSCLNDKHFHHREWWLSKNRVGGGLIKPNWRFPLLTIKEAAFGEMYSAMAVFLTVKYPNGSSTYCNCVITLMITVLREKNYYEANIENLIRGWQHKKFNFDRAKRRKWVGAGAETSLLGNTPQKIWAMPRGKGISFSGKSTPYSWTLLLLRFPWHTCLINIFGWETWLHHLLNYCLHCCDFKIMYKWC